MENKCIECCKPYPTNSKGLCPECVFKKNNGGKSKSEVYSERAKLRQLNKPCKEVNRTIVKKKMVLNEGQKRLKNERLQKRLTQINKDEQTYQQVFESNPHKCEECGIDIPSVFRDEEEQVIARFQYSHILSKAAYPEFRNDPRNFNRLCLNHHQVWEFGDRSKMKINDKNQVTIQTLLDEFNSNKQRESIL